MLIERRASADDPVAVGRFLAETILRDIETNPIDLDAPSISSMLRIIENYRANSHAASQSIGMVERDLEDVRVRRSWSSADRLYDALHTVDPERHKSEVVQCALIALKDEKSEPKDIAVLSEFLKRFIDALSSD